MRRRKDDITYSEFTRLVRAQFQSKREGALDWRFGAASARALWTMETFPFARQPGVNRKQMRGFAELEFIAKAENIVLVGKTGVGKTGLACSLLLKALENGYRCQFVRAQDLFDEMYASLADRSTRQLLKRLARVDVLLIDELGYLNLKPEQSNIFFKLMEERYRQRFHFFGYHSLVIMASGPTSWAGRPVVEALLKPSSAALHPARLASLSRLRSCKVEGTPMDDRGQEEYIHRVLEAYRQTPGTMGTVRRPDRVVATQLYQRGVSVSVIENAFLLAAARRLIRPAEAPPLGKIRSLAYFLPVIEEVLGLRISPNYFEYLRYKLKRVASTQ